jgi:hypothetical protein
MVRLHGEGVDWRKVDIDPMALYASGGRGESWMVSRWFHSNHLSWQCRDIFLYKMCCSYGMLNGIINSWKVRA